MRVISQSRLKQFWTMPGRADSEGPLRAWYTHVGSKSVAWRAWAEVRSSFATVSLIGNCVVFNIGGNKYRLVTRVLYPSQKVFVLRVMTHAEYDENKWPADCGCFEQPPTAAKKLAGKTPPRKRKRK